MVQPAAKKRGADPHVPVKSKRLHSADLTKQKLEQGLEESMAGSDPVTVGQPAPLSADKCAIATDKNKPSVLPLKRPAPNRFPLIRRCTVVRRHEGPDAVA
jgi:hypothetical protein